MLTFDTLKLREALRVAIGALEYYAPEETERGTKYRTDEGRSAAIALHKIKYIAGSPDHA